MCQHEPRIHEVLACVGVQLLSLRQWSISDSCGLWGPIMHHGPSASRLFGCLLGMLHEEHLDPNHLDASAKPSKKCVWITNRRTPHASHSVAAPHPPEPKALTKALYLVTCNPEQQTLKTLKRHNPRSPNPKTFNPKTVNQPRAGAGVGGGVGVVVRGVSLGRKTLTP